MTRERMHDVTMCPDCACSVANGLDSIDVTNERRDEIAAGLVRVGPQAAVDTRTEPFFSKWPCDVCGTHLGGDRLRGWTWSTECVEEVPA